jgi:hypothetical protein
MFVAYLLCTSESQPFYAGSGKAGRQHASTRSRGGTTIISFEHETRAEAVAQETEWIRQYGRKLDGGLLENIRIGDRGGVHGHKISPELIEKLRQAQIGRPKLDGERATISARMMGNQNLLGHVHSKETRAKISTAGKGRKLELSPEERARRGAAIAERNRNNPPRRGTVCSEEHKAKLAEAKRRRCES